MNTKVEITVNDVQGKPSAKVINVAGELDEANLPGFKAEVKNIIEDTDIHAFIFNFSRLEFMGSSVVGYFMDMQAKLAEKNQQVFFTDCNQTIRDIINFVGLNRLISCCMNVDEAIGKAGLSDGKTDNKPKDNQ